MIKYRPHRELLDDSMREMREVASFAELVRCMRGEVQSWYPPDQLPTEQNTAVQPYGSDERIGWKDTHIVTVSGQAWGFTDGPVERDADAQIHDMEFIAKAARAFLHPLLAGSEPEVQSAVIADLAATYLAGVAPPLRPQMRQMFIDLVDELVPENERELFGDRGHPFMR